MSRGVLYSIIAMGFSVLLFGVLLLLIGSRIKETPKRYSYQISHFDPLRNEYKTGSFSSVVPLSRNGHISFWSEGRSVYSTISHASNLKFKCYGTCTCKESRRSVGVVSKTLSFIIPALTAVAAVNVAKEFFDDECFENLGDWKSCPKDGEIESDIESCDIEDEEEEEDEAERVKREQVARQNLQDMIDGYQDVRMKEYEYHKTVEHFVYFCEGHCLTRQDEKYRELRIKEPLLNRNEEVVSCEELGIDEFMTHTVPVGTKRTVVHPTIVQKFIRTKLAPYCNSESLRKRIVRTYKAVEKPPKTMDVPVCKATPVKKNVHCSFIGVENHY